MNDNLLPMVSCICVTHKKPAFLKRAIGCFLAQTYENKQLVVLYEDHDLATCHFVEMEHFPANVKLVKVSGSPKRTLGTLRNMAIEASEGLYVCQWDDDDWYHKDRLVCQFDAIVKAKTAGSILTQWLVFDYGNSKAYMSNIRSWEGSIMCSKEFILKKGYDNVPRGEDTSLINYLTERKSLAFINNMAGLYIYVYHGSNTWTFNHFNEIFNHSRKLFTHSNMIKEILDGITSVTESSEMLNDYLSIENRLFPSPLQDNLL